VANARFVAVLTDAPLIYDEVLQGEGLAQECESCSRCTEECRSDAFRPAVTVRIGGVRETFHPIDRLRCDWAKRYSLVADEGNRYMGWQLDEPPPDDITPEALAEALRKHPPISRLHACNVERCVLACPYARPQPVA
jgi:hypothetical protein